MQNEGHHFLFTLTHSPSHTHSLSLSALGHNRRPLAKGLLTARGHHRQACGRPPPLGFSLRLHPPLPFPLAFVCSSRPQPKRLRTFPSGNAIVTAEGFRFTTPGQVLKWHSIARSPLLGVHRADPLSPLRLQRDLSIGIHRILFSASHHNGPYVSFVVRDQAEDIYLAYTLHCYHTVGWPCSLPRLFSLAFINVRAPFRSW